MRRAQNKLKVSLSVPLAPSVTLDLPSIPEVNLCAFPPVVFSTNSGVTSLNSLNGNLYIVGVGAVSVTQSGNYITVSGAPTNVSGYYITSGEADARYYPLNGNPSGFAYSSDVSNSVNSLSGYIAAVSGVLVSQINSGSSGPQTITYVNGFSGAVTLSGGNNIIIETGQNQTILIRVTGLAFSGDLYNTGSSLYSLINIASGSLLLDISATGAAAITTSNLYSNNIGVNLSGVLEQTGSYLYNQLNIFSGYAASNYATNQNLELTGSNLFNLISASSGIALSRIEQTGAVLTALIQNLSGQNNLDYATKNSLTQSGISLGFQNSALSGFTTGISGSIQSQINTLPTIANLQATGSQAWNAANNNAINLSGNLTASGILLINRDNNISGALQIAIDNINAGTGNINNNVVYTTGTQFINGTKYFAGNTYIDNLFVTGTQFTVNTIDFSVGDNWIILNATGGARDSALFISTGITGISATGAILGLDVPSNSWRFGFGSQLTDLINLPRIASGEAVDILESRLTQSGINLINIIGNTGSASWNAANNNSINLSGNLSQTGQTLIARDAVISGGLELRIAASGSNTIAYTNLVGTIISGSIQNTGSSLYTLLTGLSGQSNANYATVTNLALTGSQSWNAAQNNSINLSGNLSQSGIVLRGQINSLSGLTTGASGALQSQINVLPTALNLATTGSNLYILITGLSGQNVIDFATKVSLTQSGITLGAQITGASGALFTQVFATGIAAINAANLYSNNIGNNLSGNLTQTGSVLLGLITGQSGFNIGQYYLRSNPSGFITTGQTGQFASNIDLTTTGRTLFNQTTGLSGYLISLISASSAGVASLNGLSGVVSIYGTGGIVIYSQGQNLIVSGTTDEFTYATRTYVSGVSGDLRIAINQTGQAAILYASGADQILSGMINSLSGFLTGALAPSGELNFRVTLTTGNDFYSIPFIPPFLTTPRVWVNQEVEPASTIIYGFASKNITSSGFDVIFSDTLDEIITLDILAKTYNGL